MSAPSESPKPDPVTQAAFSDEMPQGKTLNSQPCDAAAPAERSLPQSAWPPEFVIGAWLYMLEEAEKNGGPPPASHVASLINLTGTVPDVAARFVAGYVGGRIRPGRGNKRPPPWDTVSERAHFRALIDMVSEMKGEPKALTIQRAADARNISVGTANEMYYCRTRSGDAEHVRKMASDIVRALSTTGTETAAETSDSADPAHFATQVSGVSPKNNLDPFSSLLATLRAYNPAPSRDWTNFEALLASWQEK